MLKSTRSNVIRARRLARFKRMAARKANAYRPSNGVWSNHNGLAVSSFNRELVKTIDRHRRANEL